jgi:hypothetical protein
MSPLSSAKCILLDQTKEDYGPSDHYSTLQLNPTLGDLGCKVWTLPEAMKVRLTSINDLDKVHGGV